MIKCSICNSSKCNNKLDNIKFCTNYEIRFLTGKLNKSFLKNRGKTLSTKFKNFAMRHLNTTFILVPYGFDMFELYYKETGEKVEPWRLSSFQLEIDVPASLKEY